MPHNHAHEETADDLVKRLVAMFKDDLYVLPDVMRLKETLTQRPKG